MTEVSINPHQARLDEFAGALKSCREIFKAMWRLGFHEPSTERPSAAWESFQLIITGPSGTVWPLDLNRQPRSVAVKLLHQQADYCYALGLLVGAGEAGDPAFTLARSVVEYGARGYWLLDPAVEHRGRCARAVLFELVSLHHARDAATDMPASQELAKQRAVAKAVYKQMKKTAEERFANVILTDDPARWSIEGQGYASWTAISESWSSAHETGVHGGALYKLLSVLGHPQGFSATFGLQFDADGTGVRTIAVERVEKLVRLAVASCYSALTLLANYTGHRPKELVEWENYIESVVPGIFALDSSA